MKEKVLTMYCYFIFKGGMFNTSSSGSYETKETGTNT